MTPDHEPDRSDNEPTGPKSLLLVEENGRTHLVSLTGPRQELPGIGRFSTSIIEGHCPGETVTLAGKELKVLRPTLADILAGLKRGPQWVSLKDGAWLIGACGLGAGDMVAEAGAGSGALTIQLAWAVAPTGRVVSLDNRPEHLKVARANVTRAGLAGQVEFHHTDATQGFPSPTAPAAVAANLDGLAAPAPAAPTEDSPFPGYSAIILDLPEPWNVLGPAAQALVPGGRLAAYLPTTNQVERLAEALMDYGTATAVTQQPREGAQRHIDGTQSRGKEGGERGRKDEGVAEAGAWTPPQIVENIQREWQARPGAMRPQTRMLGHTGFCVTTRWLGG